MPGNTFICGNYLVGYWMSSGAQLLLPSLSYQGVVDYHFYELGPVINGVRIARLIIDPGLDDICRSPLVTTPDAIYKFLQWHDL